MENKERYIDGRRSSIYFFSVLYLMMVLVIVMLIFPTFPYQNHLPYMHLYLLIPVVIVKVGLPNSKLAKWLATSVIIYRFK
jgi:hypothetical protein